MKTETTEEKKILMCSEIMNRIFVSKLLNDEFQVTKADQYTVVLFVLKKYQF